MLRPAAIRSLLVAGCCLLAHPLAIGGVSSENVIVVVNADSYESRTVANQYVADRNIPSANVIFLDGISSALEISLEEFKSKILQPVFKQISQRGLSNQTRVIAYSAGLPTTVDITPHRDKLEASPTKRYITPKASINGLTYLYRFVLADDPQYLDFSSNLYCRGAFERNFVNPFWDSERRDRFELAQSAAKSGNHEDAAREYERLFEASSRLAPLALLAAEQWAEAGDASAAKHLIVKAISAGWNSRTWLSENEQLGPLIDQPPLKSLAGRLSTAPIAMQFPIGFSSLVAWTPSGYRLPDPRQGVPYMMSCMLGVVHPWGSNVQQAADVLKRAATGDRTYPDAAFWFAVTGDVRVKTRIAASLDAKDLLEHLGRDSTSTIGTIPDKPGRCVGLMLGTARMDLSQTRWTFVPGALADNLTSHGGNYALRGQTKLTELLHAGAAISSGTVTEPYSLQPKFPHPIMYGYYGWGVTAIEAFYLSVASPYQLLIVGDPLAQPYAAPPLDTITVGTPEAKGDQTVLTLTRQPADEESPDRATGAIEIYLEGRLAKRIPPRNTIQINLPASLQGAIDFRAVLVGDGDLQPKRSLPHWIDFQGPQPIPTALATLRPTAIEVACQGADSIDLLHHGQSVGAVAGDRGTIQIDPQQIGGGSLRLRPVAKFGDQTVPGRAITIDVPIEIPPSDQTD